MVESPPVNHLVTLRCTTDLEYNLFIFHKLILNASLMYDTQEKPKTEINTKGLDFVVECLHVITNHFNNNICSIPEN